MRKYYFGVFAIIVTVASFAFTIITKQPLPNCPAPKKWFKYTGPSCPGAAVLSDVLNSSNYTVMTPQEVAATCSGTAFLCALCAAENGTTNKPHIDSTLQMQLVNYYFSVGTNVASTIVEKP